MLRTELQSKNDSARIWHIDNRWDTAADIRRDLSQLQPVLDRCTGRNVALQISNPRRLAEMLLLLDGAAAQMLLIPTSVDPALCDGLLDQSISSILISDSGDAALSEPYQITVLLDSEAGPAQKTAWIIPTSGTTNVPKLVSHNLNSLTDAVRSSSVSKEFVWGLMYDLNRFAGLQVFFQAFVGGSGLVFPNLFQPLEQILNDLVDSGVNALSATPTYWRKILMTHFNPVWNLRQITLGGEIADQKVLDALRARFPKARITHVYASTEAGVGFSVNDGLEGFPSNYVGTTVNGVGIEVDSSGSLMLRKSRYAGAYLGHAESLIRPDGFIDTGDIVSRRGDRCVFMGRSSGAINIGGNKVIPEDVERVIRMADCVAEVRVFPKRSSMTGALVSAEVVLSDTEVAPNTARESIRKICRQYLEPYKVPALIAFVEKLEPTAAGKLERRKDE